MEQRAIAVLSDPLYRGFGPTLAAEYLSKKHQISVSKETLRHWMAKAGLWKAGQRRVSMIDDATSRLLARFVGQDTSEENRLLLQS